MENQKVNYWIVVASKDHITEGIKGNFIQANHGKKSPMKKVSKGDKVICYSSKEKYGEKQPYQKFTAIGEVSDDESFVGIMAGGDFQPYRRMVQFYETQEASIKPLIDQLSFIQDKKKWGYPFRWGFFEISKEDYEIIKNQMIHG